MKKVIASFDVDAQKGFTPLCPNELPVPGGDEIVPALNRIAELASVRVGSKDAHSPSAKWVVKDAADMLQPTGLSEADITWVSHCVPGTAGFDLLDGLPSPKEYDYFVWKGIELDIHPYGACYHDLSGKLSTGVIEYLKANSITTVIVGGLAFEYCVATTCKQLADAGFEVLVYMPATRALNPEAVEQTRQSMWEEFRIICIDNEEDLVDYCNG